MPKYSDTGLNFTSINQEDYIDCPNPKYNLRSILRAYSKSGVHNQFIQKNATYCSFLDESKLKYSTVNGTEVSLKQIKLKR
jgi:hypothetical protein